MVNNALGPFQFLSLKVGDERQQLVPVLTTMLKLSPEEKTTLDAAAQGERERERESERERDFISKERKKCHIHLFIRYSAFI